MALLDLLGRRWSLRVLWELHEAGALGFAELQASAEGVSPSVLSTRLKELVEAGLVVCQHDGRYAPGPDAAELARILLRLSAWAERWAARDGGSAHRRAARPEALPAPSPAAEGADPP
jgi:DNA-binding HxlR family transcriptional regulator